MKIQYIGHSCFLLQASDGTSIVTDPYGDVGLPFPRISAAAVTVSHGHYDHCNVEAVGGHPRVFSEAGKFSVGNISIEASESFHDDVKGTKRGKNLIFSFLIDGVRVCHMGDIGQKFDFSFVNGITKPDVLLIPVGGNYTIDGEEAAKYVDALDPAVVIPMHYHVRGLTVDIEDERRFLRAMGGKFSTKKELSFTAATLPSTRQIIVMERS